MSPIPSRSLSSEEKVIVALACLLALCFFLFLPKSCQMGATAFNVRNFLPSDSSESQVNARTVSNDLASSDANPQAADTKLTAALEAKEKAEKQAEAYKLELVKLSREASLANQSGTSKVSNLSLQKANSLGIPVAAAAGTLSKEPQDEIEKLTNTLEARTQEVTEKNQALLTRQEELANQEQALTSKEKEIAQLQATQKKTAVDHQRTRSSLESQNQSLKEKIAKLEKQLPKNPETENTDDPSNRSETSEIPEGEANGATPETPESKTLEGPLPSEEEMPIKEEETNADTPKETESSFAESDADLDEARKNLVLAIRDMEPLRGSALQSRYQELSSSLKAHSLARIQFSSGKSDLKSTEAAKIVALAQKANPGSKFLVAGFADMSGTKAGNATLSSARAKIAANFLGEKVGYNRVSAIYLGQTARFGAKPENRVVEIWELKSSQ